MALLEERIDPQERFIYHDLSFFSPLAVDPSYFDDYVLHVSFAKEGSFAVGGPVTSISCLTISVTPSIVSGESGWEAVRTLQWHFTSSAVRSQHFGSSERKMHKRLSRLEWLIRR
jgi:hypothetical protein